MKYILKLSFISMIALFTNLYSEVNITVNPSIIQREISPQMYGGGIVFWDQVVFENRNNEKLINAYRDLGVKYMRFPHGTYALHYTWENTWADHNYQNSWIESENPNTDPTKWFHTSDFMELCRNIGPDVEPVFVVNTYWYHGNVIKDNGKININRRDAAANCAAEWVAYCNGDINDTRVIEGIDIAWWANKRKEDNNNNPEPYNVKYWEIGNEDWDLLTPTEYLEIFNVFVEKMKKVDPTIKVIAQGLLNEGYFCHTNAVSAEDWNDTILMANDIDYIAPHIYLPFNQPFYSTYFPNKNAIDFISVNGLWEVDSYGTVHEKGFYQTSDGESINILDNSNFVNSQLYPWVCVDQSGDFNASVIPNSDYKYSGTGNLRLESINEYGGSFICQDVTVTSNNSYTYIAHVKADSEAAGNLGLHCASGPPDYFIYVGKTCPLDNGGGWNTHLVQYITQTTKNLRVLMKSMFTGIIDVGNVFFINNKSVSDANNLLTDPGFEANAWQWLTSGGLIKTLNSDLTNVFDGNYSMKLSSDNAYGSEFMYQNIKTTQFNNSGKYTYVVHVKSSDATGYIKLSYWDGTGTYGEYFEIENDSKWHSYAINVSPDLAAPQDLRFFIQSYFTGSIYVDKALLFDYTSETNLLNNASFEENISSWVEWDEAGALTPSYFPTPENLNAMKLTSNETNNDAIFSQSVSNLSTRVGKTYKFKIRAKADESFSGYVGLKYYDGYTEEGDNFIIDDSDWKDYEIKFKLREDASDFKVFIRDFFTGSLQITKATLYEEIDNISYVKNFSDSGNYFISSYVSGRTKAGCAGIVFRYQDVDNYYSALIEGRKQLNLYKTVNGQRSLLLSGKHISSLTDTSIIAVSTDDSNIKVKAWNLKDEEPETWSINVSDNSFVKGSVGLITDESQALFDFFWVSPLETTVPKKYENLLAQAHLNRAIKKQQEYINESDNQDVKIFLSEYNSNNTTAGINSTNFYQDLRHTLFVADWMGQLIKDGVDQAVIHDLSGSPYWGLLGIRGGRGFVNGSGEITEPLKLSLYHSFRSFSQNFGNKLISSTITGAEENVFDFSFYDQDDHTFKTEDIPWLSSYASKDDDGKIYLKVINKNSDNEVPATVNITNGINPEYNSSVWTVNGDNMDVKNFNILTNPSFEKKVDEEPPDEDHIDFDITNWDVEQSSSSVALTHEDHVKDFLNSPFDGFHDYLFQYIHPASEPNFFEIKRIPGSFAWNHGETYTFSIHAKSFEKDPNAKDKDGKPIPITPFRGQIIIGFKEYDVILASKTFNYFDDYSWHKLEFKYTVPLDCDELTPFIRINYGNGNSNEYGGSILLDAASLVCNIDTKVSTMENNTGNFQYTFPPHSVTTFVFNDNLIKNSSFETGVSEWKLWSNPINSFTNAIAGGISKEGNNSMILNSQSSSLDAHVSYNIPMENLSPGATYSFKIWAKPGTGFAGKLGLRYYYKYDNDIEKEFVGNDISISGNNWQEYQMQITIPSDVKEVKVLLRNQFTGSVYIDKTSFTLFSGN